jgi:LysR family transcriptional regulator, transcription activator of glutamate synthase operon
MIRAAARTSKVIQLNGSCVQRNEVSTVDEALSFHDLEVFLAFAEVEHLGRAAEALDLSVPAVQRTVRSLEARLGVPLVRRDGRRVRLLHAGRILADQAARVIRARGDAVDAVLVAAGRERHVLRIGYMYSLGLRVLPDLVADVLARHKSIRVELRHGPTDELVDAMLSGTLDAVCVAPLPALPDVSALPLFTENFRLSVPAGDPLARRAQVDLREVRSRPFAALREGYGSRRYMLEACARAGFVPNIAFTAGDIFTVEGFVGAGLAVSVLPELIGDHGGRRVARIPLRESTPTTRTVGIAHLTTQQQHGALRALLDAGVRYAERNGK